MTAHPDLRDNIVAEFNRHMAARQDDPIPAISADQITVLKQETVSGELAAALDATALSHSLVRIDDVPQQGNQGLMLYLAVQWTTGGEWQTMASRARGVDPSTAEHDTLVLVSPPAISCGIRVNGQLPREQQLRISTAGGRVFETSSEGSGSGDLLLLAIHDTPPTTWHGADAPLLQLLDRQDRDIVPPFRLERPEE